MTEYKDTLNLPDTAFPMKANLSQREPLFLAEWQAEDLYQQIRKARLGQKKFILHDGPPYANGHLHCGHALNKILKDIIVKSKTMSGFDAPFVPGWDCHGLPIELNVEKKIGKAGMKISHEDFRIKCREYAKGQIDIQRQEFKRLGVFGDWDNPYATFNYSYEANIVRALGKIMKNGHLQQGLKPVHWCIDCGSALAEAEVDYEDKTSPSIDVAFYAETPEALLALFAPSLEPKAVMVPIWTTTPWSLPANEAVCVHPELSYVLVDIGQHYLVLAEDLLPSVLSRYEITDYKLRGKIPGQTLVNARLKHPFFEKIVPMVADDYVSIDSGTGCVHIAPSHGPDDYRIGQIYQLPLVNPVLANGCYDKDLPIFANLFVLKANDAIIEALLARNTLVHKSTVVHSYPHCWRHKTPVIFLATPQWFISMEKKSLREHILNAIEQVNWLPEWGKPRIRSMVENRPDWCISRQRAWGTPIPLFVHKSTREPHPESLSFIEKVAEGMEKEGIRFWFDLNPADFLGKDAKDYEKITDTLDVWFESGVSYFCVLEQNQALQFPADVYFEGSDQHRGWFNSSLTTSVAIHSHAPYKTVLTHGYTVDAEGKKLSKSKGNYVALDKLVEQYGADILRLWVASTDYRNEVSISDEIIKRNADAYRRIRNTARFLLANISDFSPSKDSVAPEELLELDRWAIERIKQTQEEILKAYEAYHFHVIYQKIHNFCAIDMGSFYLDIIKDRLYTTAQRSLARRSCQTAMHHILQALVRWLAPILSFTAEEIWKMLPENGEASVFLETWYEAWPSKLAPLDLPFWESIHQLRDEVNKALELQRKQGLIGSALAAKVVLYVEPARLAQLERIGAELRFIFICSEVELQALRNAPEGAILHEELGLAIAIQASSFEKCARCWHRCEDIGSREDYPDLCQRCIGNLNGDEEARFFA